MYTELTSPSLKQPAASPQDSRHDHTALLDLDADLAEVALGPLYSHDASATLVHTMERSEGKELTW